MRDYANLYNPKETSTSVPNSMCVASPLHVCQERKGISQRKLKKYLLIMTMFHKILDDVRKYFRLVEFHTVVDRSVCVDHFGVL